MCTCQWRYKLDNIFITINAGHQQKQRAQIALKLNRLKDKVMRYEWHKDFLARCISKKSIPEGKKHELEPTIRNFDQEFVDEWYSRLKGFLLILMKDITTYCEKTIESTNDSIKILKQLWEI